jgi:aryl-alcohol dehydrogenase-like predicted oxidoreductase
MPLPTLPFGKTGHESTRVIFGAAALFRGTPEDADRALEMLFAAGVNHIDTAHSYGRSERLVGRWMPQHRDRFFLATKTGERTYDGAWEDIRKSLERLQTDHVDLLQLHNLTDEEGWEAAMAPGGALEAAVEARERGFVRFIGVTGHGVVAPAMHLRSLVRFPFDSVLLPYNCVMMRNPAYAASFESLARLCEQRQVALQTIKGITLGPWREEQHEHAYGTWYEPLSDPADIHLAVRFVLGRPDTFLNSAGELALLPHILAAASNPGPCPPDEELEALVERRAMTPLFT